MGEALKRVLLVEDEPLVRTSTADLLSDHGYEVAEADGYGEALAAIEASPDTSILVTDIHLAGERDGIALARLVAERWPHIRIVIVSGAVRPAGSEYPEKAIFFTKPYAPGALITMVNDGADW